MKLNRISFVFFLIFVLALLSFKSWSIQTIESIENNPCEYTTKSVLSLLENESVKIQLGNVSFFPEYKNLICIGSVITVEQKDGEFVLVTGFNNKFFFVFAHVIPLLFFYLWKKNLLTNKELAFNLVTWVTLFHIIFLYTNNLSLLNYYLIPYNILLYIYFQEKKNE